MNPREPEDLKSRSDGHPSASTTAATGRGASWLVTTSAVARLPLPRTPHATPLVAAAFGAAFWVAVGLIAAGLAPALLLPRTKPEQQTEQRPRSLATSMLRASLPAS